MVRWSIQFVFHTCHEESLARLCPEVLTASDKWVFFLANHQTTVPGCFSYAGLLYGSYHLRYVDIKLVN
ncbi:hypothetical protein EG68_03052 [Paragonimus skrjabini miyazakii]|uniref:Uncharacterized protein n=1 Tax=Paragonimus skrjabini miyazakii TaxID=59628 RepID=A0A8S9YXI1_9TREM|nr:hypothetical protein EG68_03052 [Paragonimus skrjabini miyazakii]